MKLSANTEDWKKYAKTMRKANKHIRPAIAKTLNKQAMDMKFEHMPAALQSAFTIRDERFMNRQLAFIKTSETIEPNSMVAVAGSVEVKGKNGPSFTGWEEQQLGKPSEKNRVATEAARTGKSFKKKMKAGAKLRSGGTFRKTTDYKARSKAHAMFLMLRESRRQRLNFIVKKNDGRPCKMSTLEPGLYGWAGKRLLRLQTFDKPYKPDKKDWLGNSIKRLVSKQGGFETMFFKRLERMVAEYNNA